MEFSLKINKIEVIPQENNLTDIVKHITWTYTGTHNGQSYTQDGGNNFTYDAENFTPFSELTNEQVKQWCLSQLEQDGLLKIIQDDLQAQANETQEPILEERILTE